MVQELRLKHTMHGSTADGRSFAALRAAHKLLPIVMYGETKSAVSLPHILYSGKVWRA